MCKIYICCTIKLCFNTPAIGDIVYLNKIYYKCQKSYTKVTKKAHHEIIKKNQ